MDLGPFRRPIQDILDNAWTSVSIYPYTHR
jgi:hypothetical protein